MKHFRAKNGLRLSMARVGGEYILRITRDGETREERYSSREEAWERVDALDGRMP
jgi:hypothetical protein